MAKEMNELNFMFIHKLLFLFVRKYTQIQKEGEMSAKVIKARESNRTGSKAKSRNG